ncbi:MAG: hypothetical protein ACYC4K_09695 [Thiobacillus sp.]
MARARNIKPGFFQNDELGELDPLARLAFIGMWTIADFKGCIEFRPKMLKIQILPYDDCDIELIANNLEKARFIRFYSVQGKRYIKIVNFEKHQNPHKNEREAGSEIPDILEDGAIDNKINELAKDGTKPDLIGTARADSLLLIPDSLIPDTPAQSAVADFPLTSKKLLISDWLTNLKANSEKPISGYKPVWEYAEKVGINSEWLQIAWIKFVERYTSDPAYNRKRYVDWRRHFLNAVEGNWFKLWYAQQDGTFTLTTVGVQADISTREAA